MKRVKTVDLVPGMITAEDVLSYNNQLVLPKGIVLNDKTITKLAYYSILQIKVEDNTETVASYEEAEKSYVERVRSSEEFIQFKDDFESDVQNYKSLINDVVERGAPLDIDKMINQTFNVLNPSLSNTNLFDMLHCMREYDDSTYVHCMNVALICNVLGRWLHFNDEDLRNVTASGLLHDIGKTKIPDSIIKKPGKLTKEEYNIIKRHPLEGYRMLEKAALPDSVRNAVLMHHERCDGSGYPLGITGDKLGGFAKIVSIADVYDAMTSARVYRGPLCPFKAIALFENEGLQRYDPQYILPFLENVVNTYLLNMVRLNNGVVGKIVFINKEHLSSPTVQTEQGFIDLSLHPELNIENII